jgi:hypothetical protein
MLQPTTYNASVVVVNSEVVVLAPGLDTYITKLSIAAQSSLLVCVFE